MSPKVAFRGRIRGQRLIETFEDRIVELALEIDGIARVWRSARPETPGRVVKGALLELAPGLQAVSLLISPEGALLPAAPGWVARAEDAALPSPLPLIEVQTLYGSLEAHILLIELLDAMKKDFFPDLEVQDECSYWAKRDIDHLIARRAAFRKKQAGGAGESVPPASPSEGERPLDAARMERLAGLVQRALRRPPEHPPVHFKDEPGDDYQRHGSEEEWTAFYKENERKQAGIARAFEERRLKHDDTSACFEAALRSEGIVGLPSVDEPDAADRPGEADDFDPGEESDAAGDIVAEADADADSPFSGGGEARRVHPLMRRMNLLTVKVLKMCNTTEASPVGFLDTMVKGVLEMSGGIAQVYCDVDDDTPYGLKLVQLKRVLRGAAFARAALPAVRESRVLRQTACALLQREIAEIECEVERELASTRRQLRRT